MQKEDKERVVAQLTEKLREADTLIVADYRGLTMPQIDSLRGKLVEQGATFTVVKNTLTRRAAEAAGADALLALLEGPSAIAFVQADGDPVAVAKALSDSARDTKVLEIRGGVMSGRSISGADVESLAKLPPIDVLRGQVIGAIIAPLSGIAALLNAPLQSLVGLIEARIEQLGGAAEGNSPEANSLEGGAGEQPEADQMAAADAEPAAEASTDAASDEAEPSTEPAEQTDDTPVAESAEAPGDTEAAESPETTN
jgi:large subunit ribosomal protein L10